MGEDRLCSNSNRIEHIIGILSVETVLVFQLAPGGMFRTKARLLTPFGSRDTSHYSPRRMGKAVICLEIELIL